MHAKWRTYNYIDPLRRQTAPPFAKVRKTVVRAANGGISCIIDPLGKTLTQSEMFTKTFLVGEAPIEDGLTFYSRFPFIFPWLSLLISISTIFGYLYQKIFIKKENTHHEQND